MKLILSCEVSNQIELLYAKTSLKNLFKLYQVADKAFLKLATMELGTNLLKYGGGGYLWFLVIKNTLCVVSVDHGIGIENINIAKQKGYSTREDESLGLGLFTLASHKDYQFDIISISNKHSDSTTGSVFVLFEKNSALHEMDSLSFSLYDSNYNGDFFVHKGRYCFFGDTSGHGKKAAISANEIINFFNESTFLSLSIEHYFQALHEHLIHKSLRSFVGCIIEVTKRTWSIYGVGNISILSNHEGEYKSLSLPNGIIGETYDHVSSLHLERDDKTRLLLMSDGINSKIALDITQKAGNVAKESLMIAILHFAGLHDDKTIAILS